ncbi:MAG: protein kinase [Planctomycetales bacterium]|nr:protein kinase [Planctomycetales bacterium]
MVRIDSEEGNGTVTDDRTIPDSSDDDSRKDRQEQALRADGQTDGPGAEGDDTRDDTLPESLADLEVTLDTDATGTAHKPSRAAGVVGDYQLLSEIARGGMGVVYRARQTRLDRIVALKMILSAEFAGAGEIERFHAEAAAAAALEHSGIVPIYEIGVHEGKHFFSMAYVDGQSLGQLIREQPLDGREAARLLAAIADAVEYAHQRHVVHRDLKPGNILIDRDGQPKVTDFGLAKRTDLDSGLTSTGQLLGTPNYMAPEQATGNNDAVGPHSDVYALGAILYCCLTGRPPFQTANLASTLAAVIHQEPVAPRQLNAAVERDLETICLKCLRKAPEARYDSAAALADDLRRYLRHEPIAARPVSSAERLRKWIVRNPLIASLTAVLLLAIAGLLVGSIAYQQRLERLLIVAQTEEQRATKSEQKRTALLYQSLASQATFLNESRPVGYGVRVWELLRQANALDTPERDPWQIRQLALSALGSPSFSEPREMKDVSGVTTADETPAGDQLLVGLKSGEVVVYEPASGKLLQRWQAHGAAVFGFRFPEPGVCLTNTAHCRELKRWRFRAGQWHPDGDVDVGAPPEVAPLRLSPDGRLVICWTPAKIPDDLPMQPWTERPNGTVKPKGQATTRFCIRPLHAEPGRIQWTPLPASTEFDCRGKFFAAAYPNDSNDASVVIYDIEQGAMVRQIKTDKTLSLSLDDDAKYVACAGHGGTDVFAIRTGETAYRVSKLHCDNVTFIPGSQMIAVTARERQFVYSLPKGAVELELPVPGSTRRTRYSSFGRMRFEYDAAQDTFAVAKSLPAESKRLDLSAAALAFTSDSRLLALDLDNRHTKLWDTQTGRTIVDIPNGPAVVHPSQPYVVGTTVAEQRLMALPDFALKATSPTNRRFVWQRFNAGGDLLAGMGWEPGQFGVVRFGADGLEQVLDDPMAVKSFAWSPTGSQLAWLSFDKQRQKLIVRLRDLDDAAAAEREFAIGVDTGFQSLVFPREHRVCLRMNDMLELWDTQSLRRVARSTEAAKHPLDCSPDGQYIVARHRIFDANSLELLGELPSQGGDPWAVAWSPDGQQLAIGYPHGVIQIWNWPLIGRRLAELNLQWPEIVGKVAPMGAELAAMVDKSMPVPPAIPLTPLGEVARRIAELEVDGKSLVEWLTRIDQLDQSAPPARYSQLIDELIWLAENLPTSPTLDTRRRLFGNVKGIMYRISSGVSTDPETFFRQLLERIELAANPAPGAKILRFYCLHNLANVFGAAGQDEQAVKYYREAVQHGEQLFAQGLTQPQDFGDTWFWNLHGLSIVLGRNKQFDEAIERRLASLEFQEKFHFPPDDDPYIRQTYATLVGWLKRQNRHEEAEAARRASYRLPPASPK